MHWGCMETNSAACIGAAWKQTALHALGLHGDKQRCMHWGCMETNSTAYIGAAWGQTALHALGLHGDKQHCMHWGCMGTNSAACIGAAWKHKDCRDAPVLHRAGLQTRQKLMGAAQRGNIAAGRQTDRGTDGRSCARLRCCSRCCSAPAALLRPWAQSVTKIGVSAPKRLLGGIDLVTAWSWGGGLGCTALPPNRTWTCSTPHALSNVLSCPTIPRFCDLPGPFHPNLIILCSTVL